jgi:hypothetical protein
VQHLTRETTHIRKQLDKLDRMVKATKGYKDCAETSDRQIRAIRSLISEACFALDDILEDHMGRELYAGLTEQEAGHPIVPWGDDLNHCDQCRLSHRAGSMGHRVDS